MNLYIATNLFYLQEEKFNLFNVQIMNTHYHGPNLIVGAKVSFYNTIIFY